MSLELPTSDELQSRYESEDKEETERLEMLVIDPVLKYMHPNYGNLLIWLIPGQIGLQSNGTGEIIYLFIIGCLGLAPDSNHGVSYRWQSFIFFFTTPQLDQLLIYWSPRFLLLVLGLFEFKMNI